MALELKQQVKLSQQLVMTPQLQQAIKLLQLSRLELEGLLYQELQENPVLEEGPEPDLDADSGASAAEIADATEATSEIPTASKNDDASGDDGEPLDGANAELASDLANCRLGRRARPRAPPTRRRSSTSTGRTTWSPSRTPACARQPATTSGPPSSRPSRGGSRWRTTSSGSCSWRTSPWRRRWRPASSSGNLDDRGYLTSDLDEIARQSGVRVEVVAASLARARAGVRSPRAWLRATCASA